jgi:hypothetical protein
MDYTFKKSTRKNKKYDVYRKSTKEYITSFGDARYQQFKDSTPQHLYKHLDHNDEKRRKAYYARHGKATFESPKYFSHQFLW